MAPMTRFWAEMALGFNLKRPGPLISGGPRGRRAAAGRDDAVLAEEASVRRAQNGARLAKICAELLNLEPHRMRCEVLETKFQTSDRQYEGPAPLAPTSVQFVLWSQWRQGAGFVKKPRPGPSTRRRGPRRGPRATI